MDFVFHDDILSFFFNVGSVFVWDSIKHLKCTKTSKPVQIVEIKPDEKPILSVEDTDVKLDDANCDERNLNTVKNDVFVDATVTSEDAISNTDLYDDTALVENNIDFNENDILLDIVIEEEKNFDIQNNHVELNTAASKEPMMNINNINAILDEAIDDQINLNIDNNNVVLDAAVSDETELNFDITNAVQEAVPEIKPNLKCKGKEILLDVVELLTKMEDKNVFLNNAHEPITRPTISKKIISFKKMIKNFTIKKSKKMEQNIPTVSTELQEETFSSKTRSSIEEMDFRSFRWNATKNCDSVSRRDTSKKRHSLAKQDLQSKKWTSDLSAGMLRKIVTASQGETPPEETFSSKTGSSIEEMDQILQLECYQKL
ncbi:hypothetical protein CDAR_200601 [Caerostris darwini]|uniref:Uncharacterized protein n=1 Tax=Caerostris darwini TaxID=1538125 RepID=A0AAV4TZY8_9ARAC|nr:hypothetical protein CDAR_200601 [Caerostris darwini]